MKYQLKIPQKLRSQLWWLVITADFDYSRIKIAEHEIKDGQLVLWLKDNLDIRRSLTNYLRLEIPLRQFAKVIDAAQMNTYETVKRHMGKHYLHRVRVATNKPITWYINDATEIEQQWARQELLKKLLSQLAEMELSNE